ncbi:hypothetical protein GCM10007424_15460 [Flavobacterium suaedae]|uniref:DUF4292 domain-containing protein n=2 Tax=Flavobacterium suaedae TaxID=1767027 RepID=A0ABQ1JWQ2_9FLAO|nr:hypothetical protein GCM10007424_15460 [Flavobacterium suaedae]
MLISGFNFYAQKSVKLDMKYKENTVYEQVLTQTDSVAMTYGGSKDMLEYLESSGVENPTIQKNISTSNYTIQIGKKESGKMPMSIKVHLGKDMTASGLIPEELVVYGTVEEGKTPTFESIDAPDMEPLLKNTFLSTMQTMQKQLFIPNREVKVGESFTQNMPLEIPMGAGQHLKMDNDITYKLVKIENGKAYFDVLYDVEMQMDSTEGIADGSGSGTGTFVYDIKNNFPVEVTSNITLSMQMKQDMFTIEVVNNSISRQQVTIK